MLKFFYSLIITALISSFVLKAEEASTDISPSEVPSAETIVSAEEVNHSEKTENSGDNTTPVEASADAESVVEFSDSELVEMVGFLTAQGGGVPMLKLNDAQVKALAMGLTEGLTGAKKLEDYSEESIQAAINDVSARAEAIEAGAETIPEVEEDALQKIGFVILMQSGLIQLGFGAEEAPLIKKGFISGANKTSPDSATQAKLPAFQKFIQKRVTAMQSKMAAEADAIAAERVAAGEVFFEELSADPEVQKSESGLYYKVLEPGADEKPTLEDSVLVHYKGTLVDGTQFDSSYDRGSPTEFPLKGVVKGFGEGLTKIGAGGKVILYIPSELGYGNNPRPGGAIKPGDTLIFECELIEVNP